MWEELLIEWVLASRVYVGQRPGPRREFGGQLPHAHRSPPLPAHDNVIVNNTIITAILNLVTKLFAVC